MTSRTNLTRFSISAGIGAILLTGCEAGKKAEKKAPPPPAPVLTDYTARKDGDWMNVANIVLFKENPSVALKSYKEWIGRGYFNLVSQTKRATFFLPPSKVLNAYQAKDGENPSIFYSCSRKKFSWTDGQKMDAIHGNAENSSYGIFRINGETQWADKSWQSRNAPRKIEGIDPLEIQIKGTAKGLPKDYKHKQWAFFEDMEKDNPLSKILEAKTFEMSIIPKKETDEGGFYARWDFSPTLKELKASGDLDRACEMMLGKDYITIQPAKTTTAQPAKKEPEKKDDKQ